MTSRRRARYFVQNTLWNQNNPHKEMDTLRWEYGSFTQTMIANLQGFQESVVGVYTTLNPDDKDVPRFLRAADYGLTDRGEFKRKTLAPDALRALLGGERPADRAENRGRRVRSAECEELARERKGSTRGRWPHASRSGCSRRSSAATIPALAGGSAAENAAGAREAARGRSRLRCSRPTTRWAGPTSSGRPTEKEAVNARAKRARRSPARRCRRSRSCSPSRTWCSSCCTTRSGPGMRTRCWPRQPK